MTVSRRRFISGACRAAVAIPFLPSCMEHELSVSSLSSERSALTQGPKRLVTVFSGNGWPLAKWLPGQSLYGANAPVDTQSHPDGARSVELRHILENGAVSDILGPELSAFRESMMVLEGLDISVPERRAHHTRQTLSTFGYRSIDFEVAANPGVNPQSLAPVHLTAVPQIGTIPASNRIYFENNVNNENGPTTPRASGTSLYQRLASVGPTPPDVPAPPPQGNAEPEVLDLVLAQYNAIQSSGRVSTQDKQKLEEHFDILSSYRATLEVGSGDSAPPEEACTLQGVAPPNYNERSLGAHQAMAASHVDLIAAAIKCNVANVCNLQLMKDNSKAGDYEYSFLGVNRRLHVDISHNHGNASHENDFATIGRWHGQQVARLLQALDVEESGGRTYLDNTLVLWTNSMGATMGNHQYYNKPVALFGATDYFRTGRFYSFANARARQGIPQGHLFVEILRAFGLAPNVYEGFGFERNPNGAQREDYAGRAYDLSQAAKARGLPSIRRA